MTLGPSYVSKELRVEGRGSLIPTAGGGREGATRRSRPRSRRRTEPMTPSAERTILIVDDTPETIHRLSEVRAPESRPRAATSGERALKIAFSDTPPDLVLLDIMMPVMSGYDVCRQLKDNPDTRGIPVIFVTALNEIEDEKKGLDLGAVDYVTKPISPPIVNARVRT